MFIDAAAIIAILSEEGEAERCSNALLEATDRFTSAIAVWEAAVALARPDKFAISVDDSARLVTTFLEERDISVRGSACVRKGRFAVPGRSHAVSIRTEPSQSGGLLPLCLRPAPRRSDTSPPPTNSGLRIWRLFPRQGTFASHCA